MSSPKNILSKAAVDIKAKEATQAPKTLAQCTLERAPKISGPQNVGERMTLICQADFGAALEKNAQVKPPEGGEYSLLVLQVVDSTSNNFKAVVTSYRVGQHQSESFEITDGKISFLTSPQNFTVESVIDPKEQKPQMFASYGPFTISYPLWFWISMAAVVLAVAGLFGLIWYSRRRNKRLQAELEEYMTMLSPFNQFSKDARMSVKQLNSIKSDIEAAELVKKLDENFRLYLIRELKVPALQVSNREILRKIKRLHRPIFDEYQGELRRVLFEFEKAKRESAGVKAKDCEELLFLSRQVADHIFAVRSSSGNSSRRMSK